MEKVVGDHLSIEQDIQIWSYEQVVYAQPRIRSGEWDTQTSLGFSYTNKLANLGQTTKT